MVVEIDNFEAEMQDTLKHKGMRKKLIDELRTKGIDNESVLEVMNQLPRHLFFFDTAFLHLAYEDKAFPIGSGQTISQPYTVAFQTSLLQPKRREKVLEIGTGSGYQTAVLSRLGFKVFTIERQHALHLKSRDLLEEMRIPARCFYGDGYAGKPAFAPFDKILVTCGAPSIPAELMKQLKVGGRMVIPVGEVNGVQRMLTIDKVSDDEFVTEEYGDFQFVPMLERTDNAE
jgi:protein-L-isoaspartate(D-aspartate) O-methyltransferase